MLLFFLFFRFTKDDLSTKSATNKTVSKTYRNAILATMPNIEPYLEDLIPAKSQITTIKWFSFRLYYFFSLDNHILLVPSVDGKEVLFFSERGEYWFPTLRLLHKYPNILPRYQVDQGAIKFSIAFFDLTSF